MDEIKSSEKNSCNSYLGLQTCRQELDGDPISTPKEVSNLVKMATGTKFKSEAEKQDILNDQFSIQPKDSNHLMNTKTTNGT